MITAEPIENMRCVPIPDAEPRLTFGSIHEWYGREDQPRDRGWLAPLAILIAGADGAIREHPGRVVWIGRHCHPLPHALVTRADQAAGRQLLDRSVFIDPPTKGDRVWAIDIALRCPGVGAVIADGSGLTMAESRRLQLASASGSSIGFLARPPWDLGELSAAKTRWLVVPRVSDSCEQAWTVELLRCKGVQPTTGSARRWAVRRDHATGKVGVWAALDVDLVPVARDGSGSSQAAKIA